MYKLFNFNHNLPVVSLLWHHRISWPKQKIIALCIFFINSLLFSHNIMNGSLPLTFNVDDNIYLGNWGEPQINFIFSIIVLNINFIITVSLKNLISIYYDSPWKKNNGWKKKDKKTKAKMIKWTWSYGWFILKAKSMGKMFKNFYYCARKLKF